MPERRKDRRTYYFSVEGETEKWYLDWLQNTINSTPEAKYAVKLDRRVEKDPVSYAKRLTILQKTEITHIFDYESNSPEHRQRFQDTLEKMRDAQKIGKNIIYQLGYSNFTFELWIILHKADCSGSLPHRRQYLDRINRAYGENFESLSRYKEEDNFKRLLSKLTLEDVRTAIRRAKAIQSQNELNGHVLQKYAGFTYYCENPSLSVWEKIEKIMKDCRLI